MWAFKHTSSYQTYLNGGLSKKGLNSNKFCLHKVNKFGDPLLLATIVPKYAPSCFMQQGCHTCNRKGFWISQMKHEP